MKVGRAVWWSVFAFVAIATIAAGAWSTLVLAAVMTWVSLVLLILLHELAHVVVASLMRYRVFEVVIGAGPVLVTHEGRRSRVVLRVLPGGGHTVAAPTRVGNWRATEFFFAIAGPMLHAATIAGAIAWYPSDPLIAGLVRVFILISLIALVMNLIPIQGKGPHGMIVNDGARARRALVGAPEEADWVLAGRYIGESYIVRLRGEDVAALAWAERGLARSPEIPLLQLDAAVSLIRLGRFAEGRERLLPLLGEPSDRPAQRAAILNGLAWADLMIGDAELLPEALRTSEEALELFQGVPAFQGTRGYALLEAGRLEEGLALVTRSLRAHLDPEDKATTYCTMAIGQARQAMLDRAERSLARARRLDPGCVLLPRAEAELAEKRSILRR